MTGSTTQMPASSRAAHKIQKLFNRNLSWLAFNDRVLYEAADTTVPPIDRLRFISIVSSNLDEFFMVRVAEVARMVRRYPSHRYPDGLTATQVLAQIRTHVLSQKARQAEILKGVLNVLHKEGIHIYSGFETNPAMDREIEAHLPNIQFLIRNASEPFPPLTRERIYVFVRFEHEYAVIGIEERESRLLKLPSGSRSLKYVLLDRWLCAKAKDIFHGREVKEAFPFKIIRDADLRYQPEEDEDLEDKIVEAVFGRTKAKIVRLEVDAPAYSEGAFYLATALGLDSAALYRFDLPLDLKTLNKICNQKEAKRLSYKPITPSLPSKWITKKNPFDLIRKHDILLHHPYDSFDFLTKFVENAAEDPQVKEVSHTLYRTTHDSPFMAALVKAAKKGKKVNVYVEIKARFDELNNVRWAKMLREAGARVVRPHGGFKVHSKMTQVIREEEGLEMSYLHLGTGNYNPTTAKLYTDLGLLTFDQSLGREAAAFFASLSKRTNPEGLKEILYAPGTLHSQFVRLIKEETKVQKGGGRGHIIAKMNSLVDSDIINALYEASNAGVKIELIVRGICCLRPGVPGLSENIKVRSIIDRFLEHSRIYYFRANGDQKIYLSSADWMPRNFFNRYELAFPIKDASLIKFIRDVVLKNSLADNLKAWRCNPDGLYEKVQSRPQDKLVRSQLSFENLARHQYRDTILAQR